jgi:adenylate cyclase
MERRLAAILAADVVGYSRLIRADEEGAIAALKALRANLIDPLISKNNGRIVKLMGDGMLLLMGDGMLLEFASVVDAVRTAVETQAAVAEYNAGLPEDQRIEFRIGVNLGDVVIDGDDIHGDGVNIAARLESLGEPGGICVSDKVYEEVRDRTGFTFEDMGEQEVKNINRPVRVWRWVAGATPKADGSATKEGTLPLPNKPSIAVLPFDNMSGDPDQDYFADGISEDIITELSRFRSLFVIARNSSFSYKGKSVKVQEVGADLGVQYLVEGSVRKSGERVRITVQLVEAATGNHIWAHRYDQNLEEIFAVQDEVTQSIVATLPGLLEQADARRAERKHTENMTAYDHVMRGNQYLNRLTPEDNVNAQRMYEKAISLDPQYAHAHARLSIAYFYSVYIWSMNGAAKVKSLELARKAHALDGNDSWSYASLGRALFLHKKDRQAENHRSAGGTFRMVRNGDTP